MPGTMQTMSILSNKKKKNKVLLITCQILCEAVLGLHTKQFLSGATPLKILPNCLSKKSRLIFVEVYIVYGVHVVMVLCISRHLTEGRVIIQLLERVSHESCTPPPSDGSVYCR